MNHSPLKTAPPSQALRFVVFDLLCSNKPLTMAINVQKIKEVVAFENLSVVPDSCDHLLGVYDLRGTPVPIFNILKLLSMETTNHHYASSHRILICDLQKTWIGIPVEKTSRTISCYGSSFLPPPKGGHVAGKKIIGGMIKREHGYIPVLDIDSILETMEGSSDDSVNSDTLSLDGQNQSYAGKRVLIVEDSRTILKKISGIFSSLGFLVDTSENGSLALDLIQKNPTYDLIFTDIEMPLLDGISMARQIKHLPNYSQVPILFNSALSNPALISDIETERLGHYIVKFDQKLILDEVATIFRSKPSL